MKQGRTRLKQALAVVTGGFMAFGGMAQAAGGWEALSDETIAPALSARTLGFADGTTWGFFADGRVLSETGWGRWQVGDETLCLNWGNDNRCYTLELKGIDLRFSPLSGGEARVGRYTDL
ncbi:hypothetical protein [Pseudogemmobacter faecipullorum]|uniref:Uncharacterized protein n=1 Tax=Pseudogemmobacter faecipullorum TaxID=2755041 RepID=A0ABS8CKR3_9RHOB|nr:hypothetical protein [Pseudogemmobacter faecipullorum]MCB5409988.1 hypothetical protein [Pseudogemmobacter faecipullorum]